MSTRDNVMATQHKEPTREQWAEDFLNEAHNDLNTAAINGALCHYSNEARFLIGHALTAIERSPRRGGHGYWPRELVDTVITAQKLLADAKEGAETQRARQLCDLAARLLEEAGRLKPEFATRARDREAAVRFFGNAKVANGGKGHGVPLDPPLISVQPQSSTRFRDKEQNDANQHSKPRRRDRDQDRER